MSNVISILTGIFECNKKCKCDSRCCNRVAQNGITLRLQLFKTTKKGWGLRCLDDIPKGAFICVYSGHLLTEEQSDKRGVELGDEYFAELDFVQCMKGITDGSNSGGSSEPNDSQESDQESAKTRKKSIKQEPGRLNTSYQRPRSHVSKPNKNRDLRDGQEIECIFLSN